MGSWIQFTDITLEKMWGYKFVAFLKEAYLEKKLLCLVAKTLKNVFVSNPFCEDLACISLMSMDETDINWSMDAHTVREDPHSGNVICKPASAGKVHSSVSIGVTLQQSNSPLPLCLLTLYVNLGKSNIDKTLRLPDHNWLVYGQLKNWALAKVDIHKKPWIRVQLALAAQMVSLLMLKATCSHH